MITGLLHLKIARYCVILTKKLEQCYMSTKSWGVSHDTMTPQDRQQ